VVGIGVPSYRDGPGGIQHPERLDVGGMGGSLGRAFSPACVRVMRPAAITSSPGARNRAPRISAFNCPTFGRSPRSRPSRHRGKGVIFIVIVDSETYKRTISTQQNASYEETAGR
jgi:hypothetical protein